MDQVQQHSEIKSRFSFGTRLLIWVNFICFVMLMGLAGQIIYQKRTDAINGLDEKVKTVGSYLSKVAGFYIWNLDNAALKSISDDLSKEDYVEFVNFYDKDGKPINEEKTSANKEHLEFDSDVTYTTNGVIGKMKVGYNRNSIEAAFKRGILTTMSAVLIAQFLLSFILYFVIRSNVRKLIASLEQIAHTSETTWQTSAELKEVFENISQAATRQAAAIEETVASLEELSSTVKSSSENAHEASEGSRESAKFAKEGRDGVQALISAMREISESSKKIQEITTVIDDIAFQTNLLALNASVEAARAGEHGKGFAVVAEAVRNLSQRSASAAKDIGQMINDSVSKIEYGRKAVERNGEVFARIADGVDKISSLNEVISGATSEQTRGLNLISQAMNQIDSSTQETANNSVKVSESSKELSEQAERLQYLVKELNQVVTGKAS